MSIKAITFDFWDTIFRMDNEFDPKTFRLEKIIFVISKYKIDLDEEQLKSIYSKVWEKFDKEWFENYRTMTTSEIINFILQKINVTLPKEQFDSLVIHFQEAILKSPPLLMDGVKNAIVNLHSKYKLGIISDTGFTPGRVLRKILDMNDLTKYFSVLVFSDEFGKSKPSKESFFYAADNLGVKPEELLHIGDNERTDIAGALSINAKAILYVKNLDGKALVTKANAVSGRWDEVEGVIQKINIV